MELGVTQASIGDAVQRRGRNDAAEGAADAIALVVGHDQQHVGGALGRHDARQTPGGRVLGVSLITPPNTGEVGGSCRPPMETVASGLAYAMDHILRNDRGSYSRCLRACLACQPGTAERAGERGLCRRDQ